MHSSNPNETDAGSEDQGETPDLWRINPWLTAYKIGPMHSQCVDAVQGQRDLAMFAAVQQMRVAYLAEDNEDRSSNFSL